MTQDVVARVRAREYPETPRDIFFNAASWGLVPASAAREVADLTVRRNLARGFEEEELGRIQRRCRTAVAELMRVDADEIALAPNTSYGVNLGAALASAGPPGAILVAQGEFPANVLPWKTLESTGFRVEVVPADAWGRPREEELLRRLEGGDVRALALSAVQFASGHRADLRLFGEACRARGVLFCVDAIQALGAVPLHPRDAFIDVLASGGQKWLCAPWGSGFAYVRRELLERFDPPMVSWLAVQGATRFEDMLHYRMDFLTNARRFELATLGIQDYLGLARSVEIFLEMGLENVERHLRAVHEPLVAWIRSRDDVTAITPLEPERRAGILSFALDDNRPAVAALEAAGVVFAVRERGIRFAPHFYNTVDEMETAVELLDRTAR